MIKVYVYGRIDLSFEGVPTEYQLISASLVEKYKDKETELPVVVAVSKKVKGNEVLYCVPLEDFGDDRVEHCGLFVWTPDERFLGMNPLPLYTVDR